MKTILILNELEFDLQYLILDGDYSKFNGIVINGFMEDPLQKEFCDLVYSVNGGRNHVWTEDVSLLESKQWDKVAICTFLP